MNSLFLLILAILTLLAFSEARVDSDKSLSKTKPDKDTDNDQKVIQSPTVSKKRLRKKVWTDSTAKSNKTGSIISGTAKRYKCKGRRCRGRPKRPLSPGNSRRIKKPRRKTTFATKKPETTTQRIRKPRRKTPFATTKPESTTQSTVSFTTKRRRTNRVKKPKRPYESVHLPGLCAHRKRRYGDRSKQCTRDGRYKTKQCTNTNRYSQDCVCVNPQTGEEIPGPPVSYKNDDECQRRVREYFGKLTECQKRCLRAKELTLMRYKDAIGPQCTEDGLFRRKQWNPLSGTWCVDPKTGKEIPNTRSRGWEEKKLCPGE